MKKIVFLLLIVSKIAVAQHTVDTSPIKWYDFETAMKLNKKNPKPIMIDVYTDWCGWCKHMMKTTFTNPQIANYINTYYYPVRLNAESNDTIEYKDSAFVSVKRGNKYIQTLAYTLLDGRMSYPSIVYIDLDGEKTVIPGYQDIRKQEPILYYFAEKINRSTPYDFYEHLFWYTYPKAYEEQLSELKPTQKFDTTGIVHWYTPEKAFELIKTKPKKIFLEIYAKGVSTATIMGRTNYRNPVIAAYLNQNFYPVRFNAMSTDTVRVGNQTFINNTKQNPFHNFAIQFAINKGHIYFPTIVFLDEKGNAITRLQEYLNPVIMESFLAFIAHNDYKKSNWQKFEQTFKHKLKYN